MTTRAILSLFLLALPALGQQPELKPPAPLDPAEAPKEEEPNELQPDSEKVGFLQGKLDTLQAQLTESKNDLLWLKKFKWSGYVQARYTYLDAAAPNSAFTVRRGRLKTEYHGDLAKFALELDASSSGVSLKVGEASFTEPWSGHQLFTLAAGQMKVPIGYETQQSSGDREFPEQGRSVAAFNNGEYDRGVKLAFKYAFVRAQVGVFDGNGTSNKDFVGKDNDTEKDVIGRVGVDFKWLSAGVSGWIGRTYNPVLGHFDARNRIDVDVQLYLNLFPFGGTALKGELMAGTTYQSGGVEKMGQTALGWQALLLQNIGAHQQIGVRYDFWNPATGAALRADPSDPTKPAATNWVHTVGFCVTHHFDRVLKVSAAFEIPLIALSESTQVSPKANLLTVQFQAKF